MVKKLITNIGLVTIVTEQPGDDNSKIVVNLKERTVLNIRRTESILNEYLTRIRESEELEDAA